MSLVTEKAKWQQQFAEAAKVMQRIGNECREKPPEQMPETFVKAKGDLEEASKQLGRLKAIEAQANEADEAVRFALEPVGSAPRQHGDGLGFEEKPEPMPMARHRQARRGRNHSRSVVSPIEASAHAKLQDTYLRKGSTQLTLDMQGLAAGARNALMTSSGELGGFLVRPDFREELLSDAAAISISMRLARRIPTTTNEATFPMIKPDPTSPRIYRSGFRGAFRAEGEMSALGTFSTQNQPKFGQKNIPVWPWIPPAVPITPEMLEDSAIDVESLLTSLGGEQLGLEMDSACLVNGSGSGEPRGIINDGDVGIVTATAAASIDYNAWIDLIFGATGLPSQYRQGAVIVMNTATYAATLKLSDGNDRPLINVFNAPDQIYGYPIEFSEFLAVPASGAKVAIFGNFNSYGIAERTEFRVMRLDQVDAPNVVFLMRARYGGDTLISAAFKILKCAA